MQRKNRLRGGREAVWRTSVEAAQTGSELVAFALQALAQQLAGAADGFGAFARPLLRWLLVIAPQLHLAENALALHLLLERAQSLVDIVVADENLNDG
jgi:hypothetical protein